MKLALLSIFRPVLEGPKRKTGQKCYCECIYAGQNQPDTRSNWLKSQTARLQVSKARPSMLAAGMPMVTSEPKLVFTGWSENLLSIREIGDIRHLPLCLFIQR